MHVLILPSWYRSPQQPRAGVFFRDQALALQRAGHRPGVLVAPDLRSLRCLGSASGPSDLVPAVRVEDDVGVPTYRCSWWRWFPGRRLERLNVPVALWLGRRMLDRYVCEHGRPDVVHAHGILLGGYIGLDLAHRVKSPLVVTEHSSAFLCGLVRSNQVAQVASTLAGADAVIAVSARLAESLRLYRSATSITVLGNSVDSSFFTPGNVLRGHHPFVFATVGTLRPVKGINVLLAAFARAFRGQAVQLRVVGDGPDRDRLERQAHHLNISAQVVFEGELSRTSVRDVLRCSHALVVASYVETFGVSVIEAMACGLPVVTTQCGGPEDIVEKGLGCLVPPDNPEALSLALAGMVRNYDCYDAAAIRARCIARFGEAAIVDRLTNIYRQVARAVGAEDDP